jgi:hypothetical protein
MEIRNRLEDNLMQTRCYPRAGIWFEGSEREECAAFRILSAGNQEELTNIALALTINGCIDADPRLCFSAIFL